MPNITLSRTSCAEVHHTCAEVAFGAEHNLVPNMYVPNIHHPYKLIIAAWNGVQGSLVDEGLGFGREDNLAAMVYKRGMRHNSAPNAESYIKAGLEQLFG